VVFIIRQDFKDLFKEKISDKYTDKINIEIVYQNLHDLPQNFTCPAGREKPWGTGHAILAARSVISEPFAAINGDDFYGRESFNIIADYYSKNQSGFTMAAFQLDKTLSDFGTVSRGLCEVNKDKLVTVIETHDLKKVNNNISSDREISLNGKEPVSMNMWGFTPVLFDYLQTLFNEFLNENNTGVKPEFLIPTVVNDLIQHNLEEVHVLRTGSQWFGVTYKDDKSLVNQQILKLIGSGLYPKKLF
jgi:UTP-glucose-1-phosphate uridylyltransferase